MLQGTDEHVRFLTGRAKQYPTLLNKCLAEASHRFVCSVTNPANVFDSDELLQSQLATSYVPLDPYLEQHHLGCFGQDCSAHSGKLGSHRSSASGLASPRLSNLESEISAYSQSLLCQCAPSQLSLSVLGPELLNQAATANAPARNRVRGRPGSSGRSCSDSFNQYYHEACNGCSGSNANQLPCSDNNVHTTSAPVVRSTSQQLNRIAVNVAAARAIRHERIVADMSNHLRVDLLSTPQNMAPISHLLRSSVTSQCGKRFGMLHAVLQFRIPTLTNLGINLPLQIRHNLLLSYLKFLPPVSFPVLGPLCPLWVGPLSAAQVGNMNLSRTPCQLG